MTLEQAQAVVEKLAKHNPFVRLTAEQQQQAEQAHRTLQKQVPTEVVEDTIF